LVGVLCASVTAPVTIAMVGWVLLAFTAARFAGMGFNRIVDRDVDAINPRTAKRELPAGTLSLAQAKGSVAVASVLFVVASWQLNTLCLVLSPIALLWVLSYSYTKRFTRYSHLWLGLGLSMAPVGGYLAVTGSWSDPWWFLCVLALVIVCWSGGFDMLYALQDAEFDRTNGLYSMPSAIGVTNAIRFSRTLHAIAVSCLGVVVSTHPLGTGVAAVQVVLWGGVAFVAAMLVWEHRLVKADDLTRLDAAFFTMNGIISLGFLTVFALARFLASGSVA